MRKALDMLESEGLLTRVQGRGTFVNDPESPASAGRYSNFYNLDGERLIGEISTLSVVQDNANELERNRLELTADDPVYRLHRVRRYNGMAFMVEMSVMPAAIFPELVERNLAASSLTPLANSFGVLLGSSVEAVSAGTASLSTAQILQIDVGSPVLVLDRTVCARDGRNVEWRIAEATTNQTLYKVRSA
jgi:GntR family transcriptional regulator